MISDLGGERERERITLRLRALILAAALRAARRWSSSSILFRRQKLSISSLVTLLTGAFLGILVKDGDLDGGGGGGGDGGRFLSLLPCFWVAAIVFIFQVDRFDSSGPSCFLFDMSLTKRPFRATTPPADRLVKPSP